MIEDRGDRAGDAAFHVDGAAPVHLTAGNLAGKWRMLPSLFVARRHHVGVARENQVRCGRADTRIEVFHVVGPGFAERHAMHDEAGRFQCLFEKRKRATLGRGYRLTAQQIARDGGGIGRHGWRP